MNPRACVVIATRLRAFRRSIFPLLALPLAVTAFAQASKEPSPGESTSQGESSFQSVAVVRADIESTVKATGTLHAFQQVDVVSRISGPVKSLKVELGAHVQKGQLLAELDPAPVQAALRSAQAGLEIPLAQQRAVSANITQAELAYKRQQELLAREATSHQELEAAAAQLEVLRANQASLNAQISQARAQVDAAQANLGETQIVAPMEGEVVAIFSQEGQSVSVPSAPTILTLANLDKMTVDAQVAEADVVLVHPDQRAYFTILGDARTRHPGKLRVIELAPVDFSNGGRRTGPVFYNARFDTDNPGHKLRIGMTAQVTVIVDEARHALIVPLSVLRNRAADGRYPLRVIRKGGAPIDAMVTIGVSDEVSAQVLDGLQDGDQVVVADAGQVRR
jgi:macrolide-specific efflux system membrane fusion protein